MPWSNAELYAAMAESRLPLYLDHEQTDWQALYETARDYPRLPIVLWNAHYRTDRFLIPIMDQCPNLHVGLATRFIQSQGLEDFCERYGPGRLIYGSNWPVQSPGPLISYVTYSLLDDDSKQAILAGNITRLLRDVAWPVRAF
jgi:predicted TIM-barrel fold metal-dependent hydrolase